MQKWEYLVVVTDGNHRYDPRIYTVDNQEIKKEIKLGDYLRELGEQGWELTANRGDAYYFKRPKANSN